MDNSIPEFSADDSWIFEELGSPIKSKSWPVRTQTETNTDISSYNSSKKYSGNLQKLPDELIKNYADNMRKLIITARKQISDQTAEIRSLKRKLESSGIVQCPSCSHHFKEINHRILPKYMKIFRGRMMVEVEFSSLDHMAEWLTLNGLDINSDGLPTMIPIEPSKLTLENTNSLLPELVKQIVTKKNDSLPLKPTGHFSPRNTDSSSDIKTNIYKNDSQGEILIKKSGIVVDDISASTASNQSLRVIESKAPSSSSHSRKIDDGKTNRHSRSHIDRSDKLPKDRSKYESNSKNVRKDRDERSRKSYDRKLALGKMYREEDSDIRSGGTLRRKLEYGRKKEVPKSCTFRRHEHSKGRMQEFWDPLQKKRRVEEDDRKRKRLSTYVEDKRKPLQLANNESNSKQNEDEYMEQERCLRHSELSLDNEEYEYNDGLSDPELVVVDDTELEDGEIE